MIKIEKADYFSPISKILPSYIIDAAISMGSQLVTATSKLLLYINLICQYLLNISICQGAG